MEKRNAHDEGTSGGEEQSDQTGTPVMEGHRDLGVLLGFTLADLQANRQGQMSARQRYMFAFASAWRLAVAVGVLYLARYEASNYSLEWDLAGTVIAMVGFYGLWRGFAFASDAVRGQVSVVSGRLEKKVEKARGSTWYYTQVGKLKARISHAAFDQLAPGETFRVYYATQASRFLAAEAMDEGSPAQSRPFGPSTARDNPRWIPTALLFAAGGVLCAGLAVRLLINAQPASFVEVAGTISDFYSSGVRSAVTYNIRLANTDQSYQLRTAPGNFAPPLPDLSHEAGQQADLYVNRLDGQVAAVRLDRLYTTDLYDDPQIQSAGLLASGIAGLFFAIVLILPLAGTLVLGRSGSHGK